MEKGVEFSEERIKGGFRYNMGPSYIPILNEIEKRGKYKVINTEPGGLVTFNESVPAVEFNSAYKKVFG